jgi:hypothetical protein
MANLHISTDDRPRPSSPSRRLDKVEVCVPFTPAMLAMENTFHSRGLIAIVIYDDPWYRVTRDAVRTASSKRLNIPIGDIDITFYPLGGFLLLLPTPNHHGRVLSSNDSITVGHAKLQLLPWTRMAGANAVKLLFKVQLCIEGIPRHAHQEASVKWLLQQGTLFERFNDSHRNDGDASYCCVLIWSRDPDQLTKEGSLLVEELHDRPQAAWDFADPAAAILQR